MKSDAATAKRRGRSGRDGSKTKSDKPGEKNEKDSTAVWVREVVEAICVALILAFLFRTFEAEAFVIPTGSMAPTLMGRHKDLVCDQCGFPFQVGASEEIDKESGRRTGQVVIGGTCPNCRHTMAVGPNSDEPHPSYKGDRILVAKYPYHFGEPERWDVIVFKYPGAAATNFIKRLVGLPNETVRIHHGDIWIRDDGNGDGEFHIARKPPKKILAMMQPVYDNDYRAEVLRRAGWPPRWDVDEASQGECTPLEDDTAFQCESPHSEVWLRYRHIVPDWPDWEQAIQGQPISPDSPKARLISDFAAYNTNDSVRLPGYQGQLLGNVRPAPPRGDQLGLNWVGDLVVECEAEVVSQDGRILLDLVEGGRHFVCSLDIAGGEAVFTIDGDEVGRAATQLSGPGTYRLRFANVDDQLVLWVDGKSYPVPYETLPWRMPQLDDRDRPVRLGIRNGNVVFRHLKVFRDIYYIAHLRATQSPMYDFDFATSPYRYLTPGPGAGDRFREMVLEVMANPDYWNTFAEGNTLEFSLKDDQYFVLGDNSPQSEDGRFWRDQHYVDRNLLIGKAIAVIWPHSLDRIPGTNIPIRFFPNFARMRLVR